LIYLASRRSVRHKTWLFYLNLSDRQL
jgi:hypothetical protein